MLKPVQLQKWDVKMCQRCYFGFIFSGSLQYSSRSKHTQEQGRLMFVPSHVSHRVNIENLFFFFLNDSR